MTPDWLVAGSLSLGLPRVVLRVLVPLKCTCMPLPLHSLLNFSAVLFMYGTTMVVLWLVLLAGLLLVVVVLVGLAGCWGWVNLCSHWFNAQWGNWQWWRADLMCESSFSKLCWLEDTVLALCARVLYTLFLAVMWWLLSQWRY